MKIGPVNNVVGSSLAVGRSESPSSAVGSSGGGIVSRVDELIRDWGKVEKSVERRSEKLKGEQRNLFEAQLLVSRVMLQTELVVKGAEALSSVVRKVQQFGQ